MLKEIPIRLVAFALWAFAVTMALLPKPPPLRIEQFGDKFEHILAYSVLAVFTRIGFAKASDRIILVRMSFAGALVEVFQAIPMLHRDCDWRDWAADTLAVAVVLLVMRLLPWRRWMAPTAS